MSTALQPDAGASYREILRASALIGGSTLVGVAVGILRVKALALLLGTAGFGLYATYMAIVELARNVAQFGMNASGVREIAAAAARGPAIQREQNFWQATPRTRLFVGARYQWRNDTTAGLSRTESNEAAIFAGLFHQL